jgi:hypothetical protein
MWADVVRTLLIIIGVFILIKTVKIVRIILTVVIGAIYMPLNNFHTAVQKWYFKTKHEDRVVYYAFTPFYWILVAITFIVSVPYEFVIAEDIH